MIAPLSQRETARLLRISRDRVAELVRAGTLKSIPWGQQRRIPAAEVARVAAEGFTPRARRPRAKRVQPGVVDPAALLALDIEAL